MQLIALITKLRSHKRYQRQNPKEIRKRKEKSKAKTIVIKEKAMKKKAEVDCVKERNQTSLGTK